MSRCYVSAALAITLTLLPLLSTDQLFAAANESDKTAPQGKDSPGDEDTGQTNQPLFPRKVVIFRLKTPLLAALQGVAMPANGSGGRASLARPQRL
jgi:hypothetical protein